MESLQVKDFMNHYPVTFTPEMTLPEASLKFLKTKQMGGPVVDEKHRLVGFLSETDILEKILDSIYNRQPSGKVSDIMRTEVLTMKPYSSIVELAQTMVNSKPKIYPVVDDDGNVIGTISRGDVLRAFDLHFRANFHAA